LEDASKAMSIPVPSQSLQRPIRRLNLHEFFNLATQEPSLKHQQMLTFYAFAGKLKSFHDSVARGLHF
jgi:hypothetical protein